MENVMNEERSELASLTGEALYASFGMVSLWTALIGAGVLSKERSVNAIDGLLLALEKARGSGKVDPAAIDHALSRASSLLRSVQGLPG
jgi:hypothetical protein